MSHLHRPRTGTRRDGLVRTISTEEVRYPGLDPAIAEHALSSQQEYEAWRAEGRTLRPARDTGLAVEGRLARERRRRERQRKRRTIAAVAAALTLIALAWGWRHTSETAAARMPEPTESKPAPRRSEGTDPSIAQLRASYPAQKPTPIIARYKSLDVRLPVRLEDVSEVGFHQAAYSYALHMKIPMPFADGPQTKKEQGTHRDISKQDDGPSAVLTGFALKMWRSRPGKPDSAVDVGAKPGKPVLAPVSGTVVKVKRYFLYGEHEDYEIHIVPDGHPDIDCVMIHVTDVVVEPGSAVKAGVTRIGSVRKLSDRVHHQLGDYVKGGGDHTHVQLNDSTDPDYEGLKGAIAVEGS